MYLTQENERGSHVWPFPSTYSCISGLSHHLVFIPDTAPCGLAKLTYGIWILVKLDYVVMSTKNLSKVSPTYPRKYAQSGIYRILATEEWESVNLMKVLKKNLKTAT